MDKALDIQDHLEDNVQEEPIPIIFNKIQRPAYPVGNLGKLSLVAQAIQQIVNCPIALCCQSVLAVASLCTQHLANAESINSENPISLALLSASPTGERKTACDKLAMKGVERAKRILVQKYKAENADYLRKQKIYEMKLKKILNDKDLSSDKMEREIELLGNPPKPPMKPLIVMEEPTIEGLYSAFRDGRPSLGLFTDEGGSFLGGYAMGKDNMTRSISVFSSLWDKGEMNRVRSQDVAEPLFNKRMTINIMAQPIIAETFYANKLITEQGFSSRFLMVCPESKKGQRFINENETFNSEAHSIIEEFAQKVQEFLLMPFNFSDTDETILELRTIKLSEGALKLLIVFYNRTEALQQEGKKYHVISGHVSKSAQQASRIATVLELFDNPEATEISEESIRNAIALMDFYLEEARCMYIEGSVSELYRDAEKVLQKLLKQEKDVFSLRYIMQYFYQNKTAQETKKMLNVLLEHKWLISEGEQVIDGKKANQTYRLNESAKQINL